MTDILSNSISMTLFFSGIVIGLILAMTNSVFKKGDELKDIKIKLDAFGIYVADHSQIKGSIKK